MRWLFVVAAALALAALAHADNAKVVRDTDHLNQTAKRGAGPPPKLTDCEESQIEIDQSDGFCENPVDAICKHPPNDINARAQRAFLVKDDAKKNAIIKTAKTLGLDPKITNESDILWGLAPAAAFRSFLYFGYLQMELSKRAKELNINAIEKFKTRFKASLVLALQKQFLVGSFDVETYKKMSNTVGDMEVLLATELLVGDKLTVGSRNDLGAKFQGNCGPDGLWNNAWAAQYDGKNYALICPGWVAGALGGGDDETSNYLNLMQVLGHEMGHHIDAGHADIGSAYLAYANCLRTHHADGLNLDLEGKSLVDAGKIARKNAGNGPLPSWPPIPDASKVTDNDLEGLAKVYRHRNEIISDYWGVQSLVAFFENEGKDLTIPSRLRVIREAYSGYCRLGGDDGAHPSDKFRIEVILRRDPSISLLMGCKNPTGKDAKKAKYGCTLKGPTDAPIF